MIIRTSLVVAITMMTASVSADSLYREEGFVSLISDKRAYRVGDNLTVLIVETARATASANTATNKNGAIGASITGLRNTTPRNYSGGIDLNESFKGGGTVSRTGNLLAQITAVVSAVEPNGDLLIQGEQNIALNNEKQHIYIKGRVRIQDISSDNSVLSTRISNAEITYLGRGVLGEKQSPGLLTRLLTWLRIL